MPSGYYKLGQRRVDVDGRDPRAFGICDRCGFLRNLRKLRWQMQWNATQLYNQRILICDGCWDKPQQQLKQITLPSDPVGLPNARPEAFLVSESNYLSTEDNSRLVTEDGDPIVTTQPEEE